jgi:hypothetical protein
VDFLLLRTFIEINQATMQRLCSLLHDYEANVANNNMQPHLHIGSDILRLKLRAFIHSNIISIIGSSLHIG